jgi:hypothetical protein
VCGYKSESRTATAANPCPFGSRFSSLPNPFRLLLLNSLRIPLLLALVVPGHFFALPGAFVSPFLVAFSRRPRSSCFPCVGVSSHFPSPFCAPPFCPPFLIYHSPRFRGFSALLRALGLLCLHALPFAPCLPWTTLLLVFPLLLCSAVAFPLVFLFLGSFSFPLLFYCCSCFSRQEKGWAVSQPRA